MANSPPSVPHFSAADSSSKRQELSNKEAIHGISSLPDSLLCHILSFLPTKHSVATSILSTRWRYLWTWVPILDFDDGAVSNSARNDGDQVGNLGFVHFVYRVLLLHKSWCTKKFRLKCGGFCGSFHFNAWVSSAIMSDEVEELDLYISSQQPVESPRSLFTCRMLKVLKLSGKIVVNLPSAVHFPILKILHLVLIKNLNDDTLRKLFSGSPLLEDLLVKRSLFDSVEILNILSPVLKKLTIESDTLIAPKLGINSPALEYLKLKGILSNNFSIENLSCLVEANVDVRRSLTSPSKSLSKFHKSVFKLLKGLSHVKYLSLSSDTMESIRGASPVDLPMFHNVTQLELGVKCCGWHVLPNFLESSHNLEVLALKKNASNPNGCDSCWRRPHHVPECLLLKLTTVDFQGFEGLKDELKLVEYIANNAEVLKTINICCPHLNLEPKFLLLQKLSKCPRASKTCELVFY